MKVRPARVLVATLLLALAAAGGAAAVEIAPHRALYSMSLGTAKPNSGVVAARGSMVFEWGETCDGWTVEQRYKLRMHYAEDTDVEITSNFVTWESKDGLRYRFYQRKLKDGELEEETRGEAQLERARPRARRHLPDRAHAPLDRSRQGRRAVRRKARLRRCERGERRRC